MANKPEELKNIILKMRPDDITRTFIQENFGNMYDEKSKKVLPSKFNTTDPITLKPNEYYNKEEIKTTLGRLVTNKFFFEDGLREIVGYVNEPITKKKLKKIDETIANALLDNKVDIATIKKYYNKQQWLGLSVHSIEQPIRPHQLKELADICLRSPLPIALDEELIGINTLKAKRELLQYVKPDYIVLKPTLHGGFMGAEEWISEAEALGSKWWITSALESNIGLNALAQWTAYRMKDDYKMAQGLGTGHLFVHNFDNVPLTLQKGELNTLTKQIHAI